MTTPGPGWLAPLDTLEVLGRARETLAGEGRVALLWIPPDGSPHTRPECDPEHLPWPITWVTAGDTDIVFVLPAR